MIQLALVGALIAVAGGVVAITARDSRIVATGLLLAMVATPIASSTEPGLLALAFRLVGAFLAVYLLQAAAQAQSVESEGSAIGVAAEVAIAAAAFCCGWFLAPVNTLAGPVAAQAAGVALIVLAVVPLSGRNVLRAGAGATVLALGVFMLVEAWVGPEPVLAQMVQTALLIGIAGATSLLISPSELQSQESAGESEAAAAVAPEETAGVLGSTEAPEETPEHGPEEAPEAAFAGQPEKTPIGVKPEEARASLPGPAAAPGTPKPSVAGPARAAKAKSPAASAKSKSGAATTAPETPAESPQPPQPATRISRLRPREPRR